MDGILDNYYWLHSETKISDFFLQTSGSLIYKYSETMREALNTN